MRHRPEAGAGVEDVDLTGRTALVTGATGGIGRETALALGRLGARVLVHGRHRERGAALVDELEAAGSPEPAFHRADFTDRAAVEALADWVAERADRIDVLVHNAGAHFNRGALTDEGLERTVAVNHLAPFVLTARLADRLPDDGRVVVVASNTHHRVEFNLDAFTDVSDYDGLDAYSRSKLANILFVRALARRLDGPTANALHPGFIPHTGIWRDAPWYARVAVGLLARLPRPLAPGFVETPATGAETVVYLAAAPEVAGVSGEYFSDCEPVEPSATARDDDLAEALWTESERLTGVEWGGG